MTELQQIDFTFKVSHCGSLEEARIEARKTYDTLAREFGLIGHFIINDMRVLEAWGDTWTICISIVSER